MALQPLAGGDPAEIAGYRLRGRLGAGGMGRVYLAFTPGGRPVAVKVLRPELGDDPEFQARFRQEIAAARRVSGLFTAQVLDGDPDGAPPWLVTAYVAGPSLAQAVADYGPVQAQSVFLLIAGVAEALQAIHAAGLVHRDLKPSNVLLAGDGPRVIDFGIARAVQSAGLTRTGMRVGSPRFMAPEQIRGGMVSPAADVFALGALAGYAATGRPPFGEGDETAVLYQVLHHDPDLGGCPEPLRTLIEGCLVKNAAARPAPAQIIEWCRAHAAARTLEFTHSWLPPAVAADLTRYAAPPALAAPPRTPDSGFAPAGARTLPYAGGPPRRRRPSRRALTIGMAAAVLVAALAGYGLLTWANRGSASGSSSGRPGGTRAPAALDACLFGTWTGTTEDIPVTIERQRAMFTGRGPTVIFQRDGISVVDYGTDATLTSVFHGIRLTAIFTGSTTSHYATRDGKLLASKASAHASYTILANGSYDTSGLLSLPHTWSQRYTCSGTVLRLSMPSGGSAELTRQS
jgi:Protein kinase domain